MGGKARSLERLARAGFPVPPFFTVAPEEVLDAALLIARCKALANGKDALFAVRSSAQAEDGAARSYAGMFETFLFVKPEDVGERIRSVRASHTSDRLRLYDAMQPHAMSAIVQIMIDADVAGVAFGRDPVDGSDCAVISAAYGLGSGIAGGDCDADTYRVSRSGEILERRIAFKATAHRRAETPSGVEGAPVPDQLASAPALSDACLLKIAATLREVEARFGDAQDMEWAVRDGRLYVLQARPVTTPAGTIWDNSNIAESYGGLVSPLTFSFAQHAYAGAYRQLMRVFGIDRRIVAAHDETLRNMLGLVGGRMYYNLLTWYRLLALVPGFRLNRQFMESMMGVREALPETAVRDIERKGKARDVIAVLRTIAALLYRYARLTADVRAFYRRIERTIAASPALAGLDEDALLAEFRRLESALLTNWEAPLVNDFFAMVFYGVLQALTARWCAGSEGTLHNDLLCAAGGMVSAEPARRVEELAALVRSDSALLAELESSGTARALEAIRGNPAVFSAFTSYLERFGSRCANELKLESITLHEDPSPLLAAVASLARGELRESGSAKAVRACAEERAEHALRGRPLRSAVFAFVVKQTRERLRDRENLRLERTRVFARVRDIMLEYGKRLSERGLLPEPRDIFFLELSELQSPRASQIVEERRQLYRSYAALPPPPGRFTAIGAVAPRAVQREPDCGDPNARTGIACSPGIVRGRVRLIYDPRSPLNEGEILVAERTDPGWVVLFPAAAAILVERGSVLSHAAIVSREMGIPGIVGIPGLMQWLQDGDEVELDGRSGSVILRTRAASAVATM
jgi:pyruvate,water dikinase